MLTAVNYSLRRLNTFGLDVRTRAYLDARNPSDIEDLYRSSSHGPIPKLVLGGGSNVLFRSDFDGVVVQLGGFDRIERVRQDGDRVWLDVGAGVPWSVLTRHCLDAGFAGIERLSGIPGTVGASPIQNIGAYGMEVGQCIASVSAYDSHRHAFVTITADACGFGYRDSIFKSRHAGRFVILAVRIVLKQSRTAVVGDEKVAMELACLPSMRIGIRDISEAVCRIRARRLPDPNHLGNAGSFFVNPTVPSRAADRLTSLHPEMPRYPLGHGHTKLSAGWLIEQCGFKGKRFGKVGVYQHNPLVVVNHGGASGDEIYALGGKLRQAVAERFDLDLVMEPIVLGEGQ